MNRTIAILGAGSAASAFASELCRAGNRVRVWARREEAAAELCGVAGERAEISRDLSEGLAESDALLICVTDSALAEVAARVAKAELLPGIALHVSGFHDSERLAPLAAREVQCGSLHPVRPLASGGSLRGGSFAFEGSATARGLGLEIAQACEGELFDLPAEPGAKRAYHAAAALLSNGTVALFDAALELAGRDPEIARAFTGLLAGTLENLQRLGVPDALTGPALRGDEEVLLGHAEQLDSEQLALYGSLTKRMLDLALQRKALTPDQARALRELF